MSKRIIAVTLFLAAIFAIAIHLNSGNINDANTTIRIQERKINSVICQLNALRSRLHTLDSRVQNIDSSIAEHFSNIIEAAIPSIVEVKAYKLNSKAYGYGTGFVIDSKKGYVITAKHVVDRGGMKVAVINNLNIKVIDTYLDDKEDFALLILDVNDPNYSCTTQLQLSNTVLRRGEFIIAIGHPWGFNYSASIGIVSNPNSKHFNYSSEDEEDALRIQIDAAINQGNSGGVVLNWYGDVVGLVTSIQFESAFQNAGVNFAVPVSSINECLDRFEKWKADKEFKLQLEEVIYN